MINKSFLKIHGLTKEIIKLINSKRKAIEGNLNKNGFKKKKKQRKIKN